MKPEAQRIAIAEACGFANVRMIGSVLAGDRTPAIPNDSPYGIPDYLSDLDAMHEAEKLLNDDQLADVAEYLGVDADHDAPAESWRTILRATAAQHAEAFLRTLGLWRDDK